MLTFLPLPNATTTITLVSQDAQYYFNQISPLLVILGIGIAITILGILVWAIRSGFAMLADILTHKKDSD